MLCLQLKPTVIRKKKSILLDSYGSPDSDGARQGQLLQLAKVRYEREVDIKSVRLAITLTSVKMPVRVVEPLSRVQSPFPHKEFRLKADNCLTLFYGKSS